MRLFKFFFAGALALSLSGGCGGGGPNPDPDIDGPTSVAAQLSRSDLFDDGRFYDIFICRARDDDNARVEMRSGDFDTQFYVYEQQINGTFTLLDSDGNGDDATNDSADSFRVKFGFAYRIVATSGERNRTGAYSIRFSEELGPPAQVFTNPPGSVAYTELP